MLHCSKTDQAKKIATTNQMAYLRNLKSVSPLTFQGHFQALGRVIHLKHLKELLEKQKNVNFDATRSSMGNLVSQLDILADTLYVEVLYRFVLVVLYA